MRRPIYPNGSGGGGGELTVYDTYAQLDATSPDDDDLGLVASGTAGEPRLFRYATDTWIPDEPVVWTIATTGAGVMSGLIDAAGAAVYPGDLGVDGNGTVYYAAGHGGRCVFIPRSLKGGIVVGETHSVNVVKLWYKQAIADADDAIEERLTNGSTITFDSGTGRTTMTGSATGQAGIGVGAEFAPDDDVVCYGLIGASFSGADSFYQVYRSNGPSADPDRVRVLADVSDDRYLVDWGSGQQRPAPVDVSEPTDSLMTVEGPGKVDSLYVNSPAPAADSAIPVPTTGFSAFAIIDQAGISEETSVLILCLSNATFSLDGGFLVTLNAIP